MALLSFVVEHSGAPSRPPTVLWIGARAFTFACVRAEVELLPRRASCRGGLFSLHMLARRFAEQRKKNSPPHSTLFLPSTNTTDRVRFGAEAPEPCEAARRLRRGRRPGHGGEFLKSSFIFSFLCFFALRGRGFSFESSCFRALALLPRCSRSLLFSQLSFSRRRKTRRAAPLLSKGRSRKPSCSFLCHALLHLLPQALFRFFFVLPGLALEQPISSPSLSPAWGPFA